MTADARQGEFVMGRFCPCGFEGWEHGVFSRDWHVAHKAAHLRFFPGIAADVSTVRNLDEAIAFAYDGSET